MSVKNVMLDHLGSSVEDMKIAVEFEREQEEKRRELHQKLSAHYDQSVKKDGAKPVDEVLNGMASINPEVNIISRTILKTVALGVVLNAVNIFGELGINSSLIGGISGAYVAHKFWNADKMSNTETEYATVLRSAIYEKEIARLGQTPEFKGREEELRSLCDPSVMIDKMKLTKEFVKSVENELGERKTKFAIRKETVLENIKKISDMFKPEEQAQKREYKI